MSSKKIGGEYGEIRADINIDNLNAYLTKQALVIEAPVIVKQFKFGQSNPTYLVTDARRTRYVLRKKPAGQLLSRTAHQIEREYIVLKALHMHNSNSGTLPEQRVPIPEPIILSEDDTVLGTPFYIMEFLDGRIFTDTRMLEISPEDRRECWLSAVRALATLSSLSPAAIGLSSIGPSTPYFPRQIKSISSIHKAQSIVKDSETNRVVGSIHSFNELIAWYSSHLPDESLFGTRIVHGDYKLDNLIFHPTQNRVIGILDWELCTLGCPVADFGNLTTPWFIDPKDYPKGAKHLLRGFKNVTQDVPIKVEELEKEYCRLLKLPYPLPGFAFVSSWMLFRLYVIAQGIAARRARHQASSELAHQLIDDFPVIGMLAKKVLEDYGVKFPARQSNL